MVTTFLFDIPIMLITQIVHGHVIEVTLSSYNVVFSSEMLAECSLCYTCNYLI